MLVLVDRSLRVWTVLVRVQRLYTTTTEAH
jgi:hypothetical protein